MAEPVKALLVTSSFLPGAGGIESYLAGLCTKLGPGVPVLAPAKRDGKPLPHDLQYPTIAIKGPALAWPPLRRQIQQAATSKKVIFGTGFPLTLLGPALARRGYRYAVIVHAAEVLVPARFGMGRFLARALSKAEMVLPVSLFTEQKMTKLISKYGYKVPPMVRLVDKVDLKQYRPGIPAEAARQQYGLGQSKIVLFVSRLVRRKGAERLAKAAPQILANHPDTKIVIVGGGPRLKAVQKLAGPNVVVTGRIEQSQIAALFSTASVFAFPAADRWWGLDTEGLGIVILEASASEVPVVAGRCGGTVEAVQDGQTGYLIDGKNHEQLVQKVTWLLDHPAEAKQMGRRGREFVQQNYAHDDLPKELVQWLDS